jgi:predicted dehydrogenase
VVTTYDILPNLLRPEVRDRLGLCAVCDVVEERARETAAHFGVPRWYADPAELARDPDVEIVAIATPVAHHIGPALAAIGEGKHVYVQKTMTLTVEEADQLIAAARRAGVKVAAAPGNHLRSPSFRAVRERIAEGAIGKVCWGRA